MSLINKRVAQVLAFGLLFAFIKVTDGYSYIRDDKGADGYILRYYRGGQGMSDSSAPDLVLQYIDECHGYYTEASVTFLGLLREVENQGGGIKDKEAYENKLGIIIQYIENAIDSTGSVLLAFELGHYNPMLLEKAMSFDYRAHAVTYGWNREMLEIVSGFLKKGDIPGLFKESENYYKSIIKQLSRIYVDSFKTKEADIKTFRKLHKTFAETTLFVNYMARVFVEFKSIKNLK